MDDSTLLEDLARDVDAGFEALALAYQHRLFGLALRLTNRAPDAEEVAQDALVRAYRALVTYPPERIRALSLRPWLFQIALNVWRNSTRRAQLPLTPLFVGEEGEPLPLEDAPESRPERVAEDKERQQALAALVMALPPRYRVAVVLRHVQGLPYQEIAETVGQPLGTVKSNAHRGVRLLRAALEAQGEYHGEYQERIERERQLTGRVAKGATR